MHTLKQLKRPVISFDPVLLSVPKSPSGVNEDYAGAAGNKIAISDGTGSSMFPEIFSRLLVKKALEDEVPWVDPAGLREWLSGVRADWQVLVESEGPMGPVAKLKAARGSHATFCVLRFESIAISTTQPMARYTVSAIGDSIFSHIRKGEILSVFPVTRAEDFGTSPPLISTDPDYTRQTFPACRSQSGWFLHGDSFLLMTDALGKWFLTEHKVGRKPWEMLLGSRKTQFALNVNTWRRHGALELDDTTLVYGTVKLEFGSEKEVRHEPVFLEEEAHAVAVDGAEPIASLDPNAANPNKPSEPVLVESGAK